MAYKWTQVSTNERTVQAGSGKLGGLLISHGESSVQPVTVYDGVSAAQGTLLVKLYVSPQSSPAQVFFDPECPFVKGLVVVPGLCQVQVLSY